jgi:hypothetical protein
MSEQIPRDPYKEWSYDERREARHSDDYDMRRAAHHADEDAESADRAYDSWRSGGDFSDPNPDGRFH